MTTGVPRTVPMLLTDNIPRLMIIDGHALVHRSWNAIRMRQQLSVSTTGEDITAVYGFSNTFLRAVSDWNPSHVAMAYDLPGPTFRHIRFKDYKAQRPELPPELIPQFDRVKQLMAAYNVPVFEVDGYEADDVIGTLCRHAEEQEVETVILTGDTDTFQLVSPWVRVALYHSIQDRKVYDIAEVKARYGGLGPECQPDIKALKGDASDNIPGVPGVGDKTAIKLVTQFGSLEDMYQNIGSVEPVKLRENLAANQDRALEGKFLTTIVRDAPVSLDMEKCRFWNYNRRDVVELFRELEFRGVERIPDPSTLSVSGASKAPVQQAMPKPDQPSDTDYQVVDTVEKLQHMLEELSGGPHYAFDTETTSLDPMQADLVGLSFSKAPGKAWYVPVGHQEGVQIPLEEVLSQLRPFMQGASVGQTAHNANYDLTILSNYSIAPGKVDFDTVIAAHLLGRKAIGLKNLALEILGVEMTQISELLGTGKKQLTMNEVPIEKAAPYACADADMTGRLRSGFEKQIAQDGFADLMTQVEMPLIPVLVEMQRNGILAERETLKGMSVGLEHQLKELEVKIYEWVGHVFNINSPQQLSDLLFQELGLPKSKRTKTGAYTTDANALDALKGMHPVVDGILEYRQLSKLKSTYVDSLPLLINPRTNRLHTRYNQIGSATGRISSNDPNLQNIPIRTELGRQVRKAFVAEAAPDWLLLSADYSQIELRVLAHLSQDPSLLEAFHRDEDIHAATASLMYGVGVEDVTADMRRIAKVLNFGVIYGLSAYGISQQTEFAPDEGRKFIDSYFASYPGIRDYIEDTKEQALRDGYVSTMLGRRRYIPDIGASNMHVRQAAERVAVNMPIQGTAADIMKLAMIRVYKRMHKDGLRSMMLLQVHDELLFEVPTEELEILKDMVREEMPGALDMSAPLKVDIKTAYNWGDLE